MLPSRSQVALLALVALAGCPMPEPVIDSGVMEEVDAGIVIPPTPCDSPEDCRDQQQVCRLGFCADDVPCSDDLECGLGERCVGHQCRFRGCVTSADCSTGYCDSATFSCAECATSTNCPSERPVCDTALRQCVQCGRDADCQPPGPSHCSTGGRCVACLEDAHCPNGLICSLGNLCVGAPMNSPCPEGISCGAGLVCVTLNGSNVCLQACSLYTPMCATGDICFQLTYTSSSSHVFEADGPIGVCFSPQAGLRGPREPCTRTPTGSNCQPNLQCMPETANLSLCRPYCDPFTSGMCQAGEKCTSFVGDFAGREFGVCMPDTGFGAKCTGDRSCRNGLSCQPWEDPSDIDEVGQICQFNVGDGGIGAPCGPVTLSDGGVIPANRACKSGICSTEPLFNSPITSPYFCFGACATDADCGDAGVCDSDFLLATASGTQGYVRGCRPTCNDESECGVYDAGVTCRVRVFGSSTAPAFTQTCTPSGGTLRTGEVCSVSGQCRSQYCQLDDSRGVRRTGVCAAPCRDSTTCAVDGGTYPQSCQPTSVLVSRGADGVALTPDDRVLTPRICSGQACSDDTACASDGGVVCAPEADPASPLTQFVLRCQMPSVGLLRGGDACAVDSQCHSGVCGQLQAPSTGTGRACFEACTGTTACPGTTTCRVGGMRIGLAAATVSLDSCAP
ncbi:MAG: hypothetical protein QM817_24305 [Archangium sp.]